MTTCFASRNTNTQMSGTQWFINNLLKYFYGCRKSVWNCEISILKQFVSLKKLKFQNSCLMRSRWDVGGEVDYNISKEPATSIFTVRVEKTAGVTYKSLTVLRIPQQMESASREFKIILRFFVFILWIYLIGGKPEGKWPLGKQRRRCVDNSKMDLSEIGWGGMDLIDLAQG
jgi:hypothetical protein